MPPHSQEGEVAMEGALDWALPQPGGEGLRPQVVPRS